MRLDYTQSTSNEAGRQANVRMLLRDVLELFELQTLMVRAGGREASAYLRRGLLVAGVAVVAGLAALLLLMQSIAVAVASFLGVSAATGQALVAMLVLGIAGLMAWLSVKTLGQISAIASDTSDELAANMRAVKEAISPTHCESDLEQYERTLRSQREEARSPFSR